MLAAGLGTRLRPLTEHLPKPLIPVGLKPLITFAFDHLIADLGVEEFIAYAAGAFVMLKWFGPRATVAETTLH